MSIKVFKVNNVPVKAREFAVNDSTGGLLLCPSRMKPTAKKLGYSRFAPIENLAHEYVRHRRSHSISAIDAKKTISVIVPEGAEKVVFEGAYYRHENDFFYDLHKMDGDCMEFREVILTDADFADWVPKKRGRKPKQKQVA